MSYSIKNLTAENFAGFSEISVSFSDKVTYWVGPNGAGKTTAALDIIWATLQGVATKAATKESRPLIAERYMIVGSQGRSAKTALTLHHIEKGYDIIVKRKITETTNEVTFDAPDGIVLDQRFLNELFNVFLVSPKHFLALSPKDQATALGISVADIDAKIKEAKQKFTDINRDLRTMGELTPMEKTDPVDVSALTSEKAKRVQWNTTQENKQKGKDQITLTLTRCQEECQETVTSGTELKSLLDKIASFDFKGSAARSTLGMIHSMVDNKLSELRPRLSELKKNITEYETAIKDIGEMGDLKPIDELDRLIASASEVNVKAAAYKTYTDQKDKRDKLSGDLEKNKDQQAVLEQQRIKKIQSFQLPFEDIAVNEEGELTLKGRYIREPYFSAGELIRIVPMLILASMKEPPELKYVFLENFSLLDEPTQKEVIGYFTSRGIQLCVELVSAETSDKPNSIFLRENKVVKNTVKE